MKRSRLGLARFVQPFTGLEIKSFCIQCISFSLSKVHSYHSSQFYSSFLYVSVKKEQMFFQNYLSLEDIL